MKSLEKLIRTIPDYPKPGIMFRDVTTLLADAKGLRKTIKFKTIGQDYTLEYGVDTIEIHADAIKHGERILIVDDLIATGGTAEAAVKLIARTGGDVAGATFIIDLPELGGMKLLKSLDVSCHALVAFEGH